MKKNLIFLLGWTLCFYSSAQNYRGKPCPYVCCGGGQQNLLLPNPADPFVRITASGLIIQFHQSSFVSYPIDSLSIIIHDVSDYNRMINLDMSSNDTTNGFVQSRFLITMNAETKGHIPVKMNSKGALTLFVPTDSLLDDLQKSLFSSFRNDKGVLEWQYEGEPDDTIQIDSCGYYVYHTKPAEAFQIGKDVGIEAKEALLKVKGFDSLKVYIIYKKINLIAFQRPLKTGLYAIPNNTDPYNTIVVIKGKKKGKNYFTELKLSEIKEGKNIKEYVVTENFFIELKNTDIKLRLF
jgi:hypothetical protein